MLTVYVSYTFFLACFLKLLYLLFCSLVNAATSFPHCLTSFPVPRSFEMEINYTGEYPEGASCYTQNVAFGTMFYCQDTGEISNFTATEQGCTHLWGKATVRPCCWGSESEGVWLPGAQACNILLCNCSNVKFHLLPLINSVYSHFQSNQSTFSNVSNAY